MILILIAIITLAGLSILLFWYGERGYGPKHLVASIIGMAGMVAALVCLAGYLMLAFKWFAADYKAEIINREYGTNYTQEEVFYASSVIDTVRQLDRNRYEVNGNILKEKK